MHSILLLLLFTLFSNPNFLQRSYISDSQKQGVQFRFTAINDPEFQSLIKVSATLYNSTVDTIYFLSTSCDGRQYSLQYDTLTFDLVPFLQCTVNYPIIDKIPP